MSKQDSFPLAELLSELSRNLQESHDRATADPDKAIIHLKEATVELGVTWEKRANGGLDFKVLKLGVDIKKQDVHSISVTVVPARILQGGTNLVNAPEGFISLAVDDV